MVDLKKRRVKYNKCHKVKITLLFLMIIKSKFDFDIFMNFSYSFWLFHVPYVKNTSPCYLPYAIIPASRLHWRISYSSNEPSFAKKKKAKGMHTRYAQPSTKTLFFILENHKSFGGKTLNRWGMRSKSFFQIWSNRKKKM